MPKQRPEGLLVDQSFVCEDHGPLTGHTSRSSGVFVAPFANTPLARAIRAHEMCHLRWSPPHPDAARYHVSERSLQVCEDARVQCLGQRARVHGLTGNNIPVHVLPTFSSETLSFFTCALVATGFTPARELLLGYIYSHKTVPGMVKQIARGVSENALKIIGNDPESFTDSTVVAARYLDEALTLAAAKPKAVEMLPADVESRKRMEELLRKRGFRPGLTRGPYGVRWGEMAIATPPLSVVHRPSLRGMSGRRCVDEGALPRAIHRFLVDGAIFQTKRRKLGGTVLVDMSGSMNLDRRELSAILDHSPAALVAGYSGDGDYGELVILAKNGRMVTPDTLAEVCNQYNGNVVDGPALRWLAKQSAPRSWVCDGVVTGRDDDLDDTLTREAIALTLTHAVDRYDSPRAFLDALRGYPCAT